MHPGLLPVGPPWVYRNRPRDSSQYMSKDYR
jgi:hypothetical protein